MSDERTTRGGYEHTDLNVRGIFWSAIALAGAVLIAQVGLWWMFVDFRGGSGMTLAAPSPRATNALIPPEPRLEVNSEENWQTLRAAQRQILNSYGWSDDSHRTLHIPIERAMELVVQRASPGASDQKARPK